MLRRRNLLPHLICCPPKVWGGFEGLEAAAALARLYAAVRLSSRCSPTSKRCCAPGLCEPSTHSGKRSATLAHASRLPKCASEQRHIQQPFGSRPGQHAKIYFGVRQENSAEL